MNLAGWSRQTVIRRFEKEPGTLILLYAEKMHKRKRRTIRIPIPVFERVMRRVSVGPNGERPQAIIVETGRKRR